MKYLLDTHTFLWWISDDPKLSSQARTIMGDPDNPVYVSAASAWEIATKFRKGKLPSGDMVLPDFEAFVRENGFTELLITSRHMVTSAMLPGDHNDPFDRILAAQAMLEDMTLVTADSQMLTLGVVTRW